MRGVVARAGVVGLEELEDPVPGAGQVLVAPLACGICGSDVHFVESQAAMPDIVPPIVLGHEFVGQLLDYGPNTDRRLALGSIVTSVPYLDTSDGPQLIGLSPSVTGGLAEKMLLQERRLLAVPEGAEPKLAALAEPLAVGAHAVGAADMQRGDVALVVGCGPVGLAVIASLKAAGHGPVVAADFSPGRRALAERIGADVVIDPKASSPYAAWSDLAGPALPASPLIEVEARPNTVVFECVGVPGLLQAVIDSAPTHSRIIVVGVCLQPDTFTPMVATVKEVSIRYVFAYRPDEFARALAWIVDGTVDVGTFITATRGLDEVAGAFADLRQPEEHCKILLTPGP
ncbi:MULTISPECIES: zinc-binding dehydrogenase [unclassified Mycobacterium]|uniref:zinc-binding dehydrogenase n=1 Tax=unclassified Mycobacterium TaxID=2642494 RepID=UPI0029C7556E|nr:MULTISPECIES: zinc-binding dehydrogenase [unclassified Mycobacterium]